MEYEDVICISLQCDPRIKGVDTKSRLFFCIVLLCLEWIPFKSARFWDLYSAHPKDLTGIMLEITHLTF